MWIFFSGNISNLTYLKEARKAVAEYTHHIFLGFRCFVINFLTVFYWFFILLSKPSPSLSPCLITSPKAFRILHTQLKAFFGGIKKTRKTSFLHSQCGHGDDDDRCDGLHKVMLRKKKDFLKSFRENLRNLKFSRNFNFRVYFFNSRHRYPGRRSAAWGAGSTGS